MSSSRPRLSLSGLSQITKIGFDFQDISKRGVSPAHGSRSRTDLRSINSVRQYHN